MSPSLAPHSGAAGPTAVPSISLSAPGPAPGAAGSQPPSPSLRYRPYTVTHPGGPSASPTPRPPGLSLPASSPSLPALASSPQAVPASSSRQRAASTGPAFLPASPGALSRRPSSLGTSPRYLFRRTAGGVRAAQGNRLTRLEGLLRGTDSSYMGFLLGLLTVCLTSW